MLLLQPWRPCAYNYFHLVLGYLIGPTLGSSFFSLTHPALSRGNPAPLEVMDREFFNRIRRNRVDPSFQSVNNPAPDFYGEKVGLILQISLLRCRADGWDLFAVLPIGISSFIISYPSFIYYLLECPTVASPHVRSRSDHRLSLWRPIGGG